MATVDASLGFIQMLVVALLSILKEHDAAFNAGLPLRDRLSASYRIAATASRRLSCLHNAVGLPS